MIKSIITDFSRVLLFPQDNEYTGRLNQLHQELLEDGDYYFWEHFELNDELLDFYKNISQKIPVYIFTTGCIQEYPQLKQKLDGVFEGIFTATGMEVQKDQKDTYIKLAGMIDVEPGEILYIDDTVKNAEAAKKAGCETIRFTGNDEVMDYFLLS